MKTQRLFRMRRVVKSVLSMLFFALVFAVRTTPAGAQTIDPQIYVCTGCTSPLGGDPNVINPASINVGFAGAHTAISPLLIIVGVPNLGAAPTSISLPNGVSLAATGIYYGATASNGSAVNGILTSTSPAAPNNNAYAALGLNTGAGGGDSESFTNWSTFDTGKGFTVGTGFNLYVYAITYALNSDSKSGAVNSPITIDFTGIAAGSFVIAYNCAVAGTSCTDGNIGETPFTNAGVVAPGTPVTTPEPNSLLLFGVGVLALGLVMRRRLLPGDDASRMSVA